MFTRAFRSASSTVDRASGGLLPTRLRPHEPEGIVERLTPSVMVEHMPLITSSFRLHGDYDQTYLEWLFHQLDSIDGQQLPWLRGRGHERGGLLAELVRKDETPVGWYVCHLKVGGYCRVVQIAATPRGVDTVLNNLYHRAWQMGAIAVVGRMEPHLIPSLSSGPRDNLVVASGQFLVHARDESITDAILTGDILVTLLDGEWWGGL